MSIKFIDILMEMSIVDINQSDLIRRLKIALIGLFPNIDLELFLDNFFKSYPDTKINLNKPNKNWVDFAKIDDIDKKSFLSIMNSENMNKFLYNILDRKEIKKILSKINQYGDIIIYRSMTVNKEWFNNLKNEKVKRLGVYWSWEKGTTVYGDYSKNYEIELTGVIKEKHINWIDTIIQNIMYGGDYGDENEITLFKNTPIELIKIKYKLNNDTKYKELNPAYFENQTFYS